MGWKRAASFSLVAVSLGLLAVVIKAYLMFDAIANLSFSYLCTLIAISLALVALHCVLFDAPPSELRLLPNLILFLIISGASSIDVVWDGMARSFSGAEIWFNLANSAEFVLFYAVLLFLPRFFRGRTHAESGAAETSP